MLKKNALAATVSTWIALATLVIVPAMALGAEQPPLKGLFKDNFTLLRPPVPAPQTAFQDGSGRELSMSAFKGRVVLLNFWATWCAPCVREMPTLDRLQAKLGDEGFAVVAVSEDTGGLAVVAPFFKQLGLGRLAIYLDPDGTLSESFGLKGLPTTFLIDAEGRIVGGLEGPAEWDSPEALSLIRYYLRRGGDGDQPVKTSG
jgi:thiol-disulfide isomerase/thioredoxin